MVFADSLLKTKVFIPFTRKDLVSRPHLSARLAEGMQGPLTLVAAPAGFGKTTLVVNALSVCDMQAAWLSLEKGDNQPERFFGYLLLAIQQVNPALGQRAVERLPEVDQSLPETLLNSLMNDLADLDRDMVLVLDDYQIITNPVIHQAVTFLLDHCPASFHLVITTRSDPPIPLSRLRARGQVVELRAADLRFTGEEAAQFLNNLLALGLSDQAVQLLEERTEGWIAGLQMAALALQGTSALPSNRSTRGHNGVEDFLAGFSGTHRYILDYLLEEVLSNQPPEVQRFLLSTAILERMCAPLCEVLVSSEDMEDGQWLLAGEDASSDATGGREPLTATPALSDAHALLEYLDRSNLFLVPLNDEAISGTGLGWFRYHHLFGDLLQARLAHLYPQLKIKLHHRAAAWLENQGLTVEAINQALAGGDYGHAARMVEENTAHLLARGELKPLMKWVTLLPEEARRSRPWLCIHQAYALAFAGRLAEAQALLQQAELVSDMNRTQAMDGAITAVRAMAAAMSGSDAQAVELASRALALLADERAWDRAAAAWALGYAERSRGHLVEARAAFETMIALARRMGNLWTLVTGLMDLANVVRVQGDLALARAYYEEALREAGRKNASSLGYLARMEVGLASVLYEQNQLDDAQHYIEKAIQHIHEWPNPNHLVYAFTVQSRLLLARKDILGAQRAILEAVPIRKAEPLAGIPRTMVEVGLVRAWLEQQKGQSDFVPQNELADLVTPILQSWQEQLSLRNDQPLDEAAGASALMLARVYLLHGKVEQAKALLQQVLQTARQLGHVPFMVEALLLMAVAQRAGLGKDEKQSTAMFEEALALAQRGGMMRVFLDEDQAETGNPVQALLNQWLSRAGDHPQRAYAAYLLKLLQAETRSGATAQTNAQPIQDLPEPLSQREIEVLSLIAQGLTNEGVAQQLIISAGTVKAHTAAIYRKLDVSNRTEAVARARQLRLLP